MVTVPEGQECKMYMSDYYSMAIYNPTRVAFPQSIHRF